MDDTALDLLAERIRRGSVVPKLLIDGRSGAGKTELARALAPRLAAQLVSLDDLYPGWEGLAAGSDAVVTDVLRSDDPGWRRWDWTSSAPAEWHPLNPAAPIVIEGCGALTAASRRLASFGIWLELDADERRRRALARDGDAYAPHWDGWAAQEQRMIDREHPEQLADLVLRPAPEWAPYAQPSSCSSSSSIP